MEVNINHTDGDYWITSNDTTDNYNPNEISWVESPFINFSALQNPFLELDVNYKTFGDGDDGAVIQYTVGDQETWHVLGDKSEIGENGVRNWYTHEGISSSPGAIPDDLINPGFFATTGRIGWSGDSDGWQTKRYPLNEVRDEIQRILNYSCGNANNRPSDTTRIPRVDCSDSTVFSMDHQYVRFRVAFSSTDNSLGVEDSLFFAFRNFAIREANRKVLAEQFIGDNFDDIILLENNSEVVDQEDQVINLYYFIKPDNEFHQRNPQTHALREAYYLAGQDEQTVIDGKRIKSEPDSIKVELSDRKLDFSPFTITFGNIDTGGANVTISNESEIDIDLLNSLFLQVLLVEEEVTAGDSSNTLIRVAREFLPNPGGTRLVLDQNINLPLPPQKIERLGDRNSRFRLLAFIQNSETKEIFQTELSDSIPPDLVSSRLITGLTNNPQYNHKIKLFPNPAQDFVQMYILEGVTLPDHWELTNTMGQIIKDDDVKNRKSNISLQSLAAGMYWLRVYHKGELLAIKPLIVQP